MRILLWFLVAFLGIFGALTFTHGNGWQSLLGNFIMYFASSALFAIAYLIPSFLAVHRRHGNTPAIAALNALTAWTVIGWIGALVWALTKVRNSSPSTGADLNAPRLVLRLGGVILATCALFLSGWGISMFGSLRASLHYLEQAAGGTWMPYFQGWIPLILGVTGMYGAFAMLRRSGAFDAAQPKPNPSFERTR